VLPWQIRSFFLRTGCQKVALSKFWKAAAGRHLEGKLSLLALSPLADSMYTYYPSHKLSKGVPLTVALLCKNTALCRFCSEMVVFEMQMGDKMGFFSAD
jgi:hypothetical protein